MNFGFMICTEPYWTIMEFRENSMDWINTWEAWHCFIMKPREQISSFKTITKSGLLLINVGIRGKAKSSESSGPNRFSSPCGTAWTCELHVRLPPNLGETLRHGTYSTVVKLKAGWIVQGAEPSLRHPRFFMALTQASASKSTMDWILGAWSQVRSHHFPWLYGAGAIYGIKICETLQDYIYEDVKILIGIRRWKHWYVRSACKCQFCFKSHNATLLG